MDTETRSLDTITPYSGNPRIIPEEAVRKVAASLQAFGWRQPIVIDQRGVIIVGHTRYLAAQFLGWTEAPVHVAKDLTPAQADAYRVADNRVAEETSWDDGALRAEIARMADDLVVATGFDPDEISRILANTTADLGAMLAQDAAVDLNMPQPIVAPGDIWLLGRHRLLCGDCSDPAAVAKLLDGTAITCLLTDPPYCSGGFQEAGRQGGSVGTSAEHEGVANDTLSTRGYRAMLGGAMRLWGAPSVYVFTDWRMWVTLFDVVESCGYGVRQMIVWDKRTPRMGRGWRAQHELVLFGTKQTALFDKHAYCHGNVISCVRTGNKHHTTEKPVELLLEILKVSDWAKTVGDPFAGSGGTLLACEAADRTCFAAELKSHYCDAVIMRWQAMTGGVATRASDGQPFSTSATLTKKVRAKRAKKAKKG